MDQKELHKNHRERTKKRFRASGLAGFEPHNVLELLLFYAIPRVDVNDTAHRLIDEFGSFEKVLEADYESLLKVSGVGENAATLIKLTLESFRFYEQQKNKQGFTVNSTSAAISYARSLFVGEKTEKCYALCFDSNLKKTNCVKISEGSVNATDISVRRIVEAATASQATSIILTHNHPTGTSTPTKEDIATTKTIYSALKPIGIELYDHIVVSANDAVSMADCGIFYDIKQSLRGL